VDSEKLRCKVLCRKIGVSEGIYVGTVDKNTYKGN
jgi:hypothetical protein